jgi:hypothetical protein
MYKAEMYLGDDTWVPICIIPTLGTFHAVSLKKGTSGENLYYSKEGTNQYLYLKDGNHFKRIGEMKLGGKPKMERGVVSFDAPDGTPKRISPTDVETFRSEEPCPHSEKQHDGTP